MNIKSLLLHKPVPTQRINAVFSDFVRNEYSNVAVDEAKIAQLSSVVMKQYFGPESDANAAETPGLLYSLTVGDVLLAAILDTPKGVSAFSAGRHAMYYSRWRDIISERGTAHIDSFFIHAWEFINSFEKTPPDMTAEQEVSIHSFKLEIPDKQGNIFTGITSDHALFYLGNLATPRGLGILRNNDHNWWEFTAMMLSPQLTAEINSRTTRF